MVKYGQILLFQTTKEHIFGIWLSCYNPHFPAFGVGSQSQVHRCLVHDLPFLAHFGWSSIAFDEFCYVLRAGVAQQKSVFVAFTCCPTPFFAR